MANTAILINYKKLSQNSLCNQEAGQTNMNNYPLQRPCHYTNLVIVIKMYYHYIPTYFMHIHFWRRNNGDDEPLRYQQLKKE